MSIRMGKPVWQLLCVSRESNYRSQLAIVTDARLPLWTLRADPLAVKLQTDSRLTGTRMTSLLTQSIRRAHHLGKGTTAMVPLVGRVRKANPNLAGLKSGSRSSDRARSEWAGASCGAGCESAGTVAYGGLRVRCEFAVRQWRARPRHYRVDNHSVPF